MGQEIQELRTVFSGDSSGVERAADRATSAMEKFDRAEKNRSRWQQEQSNKSPGGGGGPAEPKGGGKGGHGGGGGFGENITWAAHDLATGRGTGAMFRLASAFKLAGGAAIGAFAAFEVGKKTFDYLNEGMEETTKANGRLDASFQKTSRGALFATTGEGVGGLAGQYQALEEQRRAENEQQTRLGESRNVMDSFSLGGLMAHAIDRMRSESIFDPVDSQAQKEQKSELRMRGIQKDQARIRALAGKAAGEDLDIARQRGPEGDPFEAERMESRRREGKESADLAEKLGSGAPELEALRQRFALERQLIDLREAGEKNQLASEEHIVEIRREGLDVEVRTARERARAAERAIGAAVGEPARRAAVARAAEAGISADDADRSQDLRNFGRPLDLATARFRGNEEARARFAAGDAVSKAQAAVDNPDRDSEKQKDNLLALERAKLAQEQLRRSQAVATTQAGANMEAGEIRTRAAGAVLTGGPEQAQRVALEGEVAASEKLLAAAAARTLIEQGSLASITGQKDATEELSRAEIRLKFHVQETARTRGLALAAAQAETAAMNQDAGGRGDLADLTRSRSGTANRIAELVHDGRYGEADEAQEQQNARERSAEHALYLNPDGSPKSAAGELNDRQNRERRIAAHDKAMARTDGLTNVHWDSKGGIESGVDPLTGDRLNARQVAERHARQHDKPSDAAHGKGDEASLSGIYKVLDQRLPKDTK